MVIGKGLVARGFDKYRDDDRYLVFASGVSNSNNTDTALFERERSLLEKMLAAHPEKIFIYFSTCGMYDPYRRESHYVKHKLGMEAIIAGNHSNYHIFRVPNLAGRTDNPNTVLNYFVHHIRSGAFFQIWKNATRNIIDIDDAVAICSYVVSHGQLRNERVNIANPVNYPVMKIVAEIEEFTRERGNYELVDKGSSFEIDITPVKPIIQQLQLEFGPDYLKKIIQKYFPKNDV